MFHTSQSALVHGVIISSSSLLPKPFRLSPALTSFCVVTGFRDLAILDSSSVLYLLCCYYPLLTYSILCGCVFIVKLDISVIVLSSSLALQLDSLSGVFVFSKNYLLDVEVSLRSLNTTSLSPILSSEEPTISLVASFDVALMSLVLLLPIDWSR